MLSWYRISILLLVAAFLGVSTLQADSVQLVNGDVVSGKVISLDAKQLKLQSDVFGQMTIERTKIASIHLGDAPVAKKPTTPPQPAGAQDLAEQLRRQGVDPKTLNEVKKVFPLLATPAAGNYFDKTVSGLMTGTIGVQDVRKDAVKAVDEIKKLEKELGPEVTQALRPYLGILEEFIRETDPAKPAPKPGGSPAKPKK